MKLSIRFLFILATVFTFAGCSDDGVSSNSNISNLITQSYSAVSSQANKAAGIAGSSRRSFTNDVDYFAAPNFGVYWDTTPVFNNVVTSSGSVTAKDYLGTQLDTAAVNASNGSAVNIFGRLAQSLRIFCAVGVGAGMSGVSVDGSGYPANGSFNLTFTSAIATQINRQCGLDLTADIGTTIVVTVAGSSGLYDKSFTFDAFNQIYLIRSTSSEINIATGELNDNGDSVSRSQVEWNRTTGIMRVQFVGNPGTAAPGTAGLNGYRLFYDETTDVAQLLVYEGPDNSAASATRFILAGKPTAGDAYSVSLINPNVEAASMVESCADSSTGNLLTDGARCVASSTKVNGAAITGSAAVFTAFYTQRADQSWQTVSGTTALNWTTSVNMLTTNFAP